MTMGLSVVACWTAGYAAQPDLAVWRPAEGKWYVLNSSTGTATVTPWGLPGDIPWGVATFASGRFLQDRFGHRSGLEGRP
jgi:hypothetical protein